MNKMQKMTVNGPTKPSLLNYTTHLAARLLQTQQKVIHPKPTSGGKKSMQVFYYMQQNITYCSRKFIK